MASQAEVRKVDNAIIAKQAKKPPEYYEEMDKRVGDKASTTKSTMGEPFKKGGKIAKYSRGGGCESRGKTKGRMV